MQISPTSALLNVLSSLPVSGASSTGTATRPQPVAPSGQALAPQAPTAPAGAPPSGALAAARKALAQRVQNQPAPQPAQGGQPPRNLPRGSIINIVV